MYSFISCTTGSSNNSTYDESGSFCTFSIHFPTALSSTTPMSHRICKNGPKNGMNSLFSDEKSATSSMMDCMERPSLSIR